MARTPKHRFDEDEAIEAFALLSDEERAEYNELLLTVGTSVAGDARLNKLESIAYGRLKEENNG